MQIGGGGGGSDVLTQMAFEFGVEMGLPICLIPGFPPGPSGHAPLPLREGMFADAPMVDHSMFQRKLWNLELGFCASSVPRGHYVCDASEKSSAVGA